MKLFNHCLLCLNKKESPKNLVCLNCKNLFENYKFYGCPRCSQHDCYGCNQLSDFNFIFCLYTYNDVFSKIITNAKDKCNLNFKRIFEEVFYHPVKDFFSDLLSNHQYDYVILSPYKKQRLFSGIWHPNLFFEKVLIDLQKENKKINIHSSHYLSGKNNALVSSDQIILNQTNKKILFCDDVLTTGKSAQKALYAYQKLFPNSQFDLFTLCRSPQKK